jgi:hypothetical protein
MMCTSNQIDTRDARSHNARKGALHDAATLTPHTTPTIPRTTTTMTPTTLARELNIDPKRLARVPAPKPHAPPTAKTRHGPSTTTTIESCRARFAPAPADDAPRPDAKRQRQHPRKGVFGGSAGGPGSLRCARTNGLYGLAD